MAGTARAFFEARATQRSRPSRSVQRSCSAVQKGFPGYFCAKLPDLGLAPKVLS